VTILRKYEVEEQKIRGSWMGVKLWVREGTIWLGIGLGREDNKRIVGGDLVIREILILK